MMKNIPRQEIPKQSPSERVKNFKEVSLGYTEEQAILESSRCLQCKKAPCREACPVHIDIPAFITKIKEKDFAGAIKKIKESSILPAVCGRVCPQEELCEASCVLAKKGSPVAVGRLERFSADFQFKQGSLEIPSIASPAGKKVAVIGSGPSGIVAASDLAQKGYKVTLFEALHKTGGVLVYGIPEFRLPKAIVQKEIDTLTKMGVEIKLNYIIGRIKTINELKQEGYEAIYLAPGAGAPKFLGVEGENCNGIFSANEFLTRLNLMKAYEYPSHSTPIYCGKNVAVVGGGNVAMDAARSALRMGADSVSIIYRRSKTELPARREEVENAEEEGVKFNLLTNPIKFLGNSEGWVTGVECLKMELGEPDESGRRRPIAVKGSNFVIPVDTVIIAVGTSANPIIKDTTPGLNTTDYGYIVVDEKTGATSIPGVYAGGDIATGEATVISAMAAAQRSSIAIHEYLSKK
jgi:glutamate synthase (NADPH/NADH) small chain